MDDEPGKGKSRMLRPLLAVVLLAFLGLGAWLWFEEKPSPVTVSEPPAHKPVPTRKAAVGVEKRVFPIVTEREGTVSAVRYVEMAPRIRARIAKVLVREGERVTAGKDGGTATVMARLDDSEIRSRMIRLRDETEGMKRSLELAEANLIATRCQVDTARGRAAEITAELRNVKNSTRMAHADEQGAMAEARLHVLRQELQSARAEVGELSGRMERAERELAEARSSLDQLEVAASASGIVTRVMARKGDIAQPGHPIFIVEQPSAPEFHTSLPGPLPPCLEEGRAVEVLAEGSSTPLHGTVRNVRMVAGAHDIAVNLSSAPEGARSGLTGRLRIPCGQVERLLVPASAVKRSGPFRFVRVPDPDGHSERRRLILTGETRQDKIEVLSGLKENDRVLVP
ncbi:MAG: efflux RND transporter periplasmic adaptor subunit [Acidobacteriota bacterium]